MPRDPELDFLFQGLTPKEPVKDEESETPFASPDEVKALFDSFETTALENSRKATYADVVRSGGIRAGAGLAQGFYSLGEQIGALEKGSTADFTKKVLELENLGELDLAQSLVRDTIASSVPILAEIMATRGVSFATAAKRSAAIGGAGGAFTFIDNPEQAVADSSARVLNTIIGSTLGPVFLGVGQGIGSLGSLVSGGRGKIASAGPDSRPAEEVRTRGAQAIQEASDRGIVLTPGAATANPALIAQELKAGTGFSQETQRMISDLIGSNAKNTQELIDDLVSTIIPEGKSNIDNAVHSLYDKAKDDIVSSPDMAKLRSNPSIQSVVNDILKNPSSKQAYERYAPNSVGRLNFVIRELQSKIDAVDGTETADFLIGLRKELQDVAKSNSPTYSAALDAAQRNFTSQEVLDALTKVGANEIIPSTNYANSFVSHFSNKSIKEKMVKGINSISDPAQRDQAKAKMNYLLQLLPKVSEMESTLNSFLKRDLADIAKRGTVETSAFYTLENLLNKNNNEALIRFILDPNKTVDRLLEITPKRYTKTEETLRAFGLVAAELLGEGLSRGNTVPYRPTENPKLSSISKAEAARAYERLERAGQLEQLSVSNPKMFERLLKAKQAVA